MKCIVFIIFLFGFKMPAQVPVVKDSVIYLQEVVTGVKAKTKVATIKTKGEELASHAFNDITTHVSLIKDIPAGYLASVTFYFNSGLINLSKKNFNVEYKDTLLNLVIYEEGPDGTPGNIVTGSQLLFTVKKEHRGALELDLSALHIKTQNRLFIGLAAADAHTGEQVILKIRENKLAVSYIKTKESSEWQKFGDGLLFNSDIKMTVKVLTE